MLDCRGAAGRAWANERRTALGRLEAACVVELLTARADAADELAPDLALPLSPDDVELLVLRPVSACATPHPVASKALAPSAKTLAAKAVYTSADRGSPCLSRFVRTFAPTALTEPNFPIALPPDVQLFEASNANARNITQARDRRSVNW
ncbi:hypothetical protein MANY_13360 [Mycolicibacterium anyangense]|uniref:Uncharacterized protein n=1 Tax=Mycolicibacterium anyangense TaxID=1431246 RepID=A0A6N4W4S0_9MYCO|nr:hypothetical protein MANY_13360 [Mycolicibacterium anyangense]